MPIQQLREVLANAEQSVPVAGARVRLPDTALLLLPALVIDFVLSRARSPA